jgi:hypothetical protein
VVIRLIPRTNFVFDNLANGQTQYIRFAQHIDLAPFQEVDLVVRTHASTISSGFILVEAAVDPWTPEDPANQNLNPSLLAGPITIGAAPAYSIVSLPAFGGLAMFAVAGTGGTGPSLNCALSVDLVCKTGDPAGRSRAFNTYIGYL